MAATARRLRTAATRRSAGTELPPFRIDVDELPPAETLDRATSDDVLDGRLLASHRSDTDGAIVVTVHRRPVLLWASDDRGRIHDLVHGAVVEQLAEASGTDPLDIDPGWEDS